MQSTLCTARALCLSCTKAATHLAHLGAVVQRLLYLRLLPLTQAALMHPLLRPDAAAHGTSSTALCAVCMHVRRLCMLLALPRRLGWPSHACSSPYRHGAIRLPPSSSSSSAQHTLHTGCCC